jgi:hypothetical protein
MCDYSLMSVPNRLAVNGEELVTHRFHSGALGLTTPRQAPAGFWAAISNFWRMPPVPAVCIPPGSKLLVRDIPGSLQRELKVSACEEVRFTQVSVATNCFRDTIRFSNGREVLLQRLQEGQRVSVLDISLTEEHESMETHEIREPRYV